MAERPLCACGCGQPVEESKSHPGRWNRYVHGHNAARGPQSSRWKGGRRVMSSGYVGVYEPSHPRASGNGYVFEHVLVAEEVLGKPLPEGVEVHHFDEDRQNNAPGNLVVCEDSTYHKLLHQRQRALDECGHAGWLKCIYCKSYDDPSNMHLLPPRPGSYNRRAYHTDCERAAQRERRSRRSQ